MKHMLDGIKIIGYRSFKKEVTIQNLNKVNIFIGPNNCGKSNILRFLKTLGELNNSNHYKKGIDYSHGGDEKINYAIKITKQGYAKEIYNSYNDKLHHVIEQIEKDNNGIWLWYDAENSDKAHGIALNERLCQILAARLNQNQSENTGLIHYSGNSHDQRCRDIIETLKHQIPHRFKVHEIDVFRMITAEDTNNVDGNLPISINGRGLIRQFRNIKNPEFIDFKKNREIFDKIIEFVKSLLQVENVQIEIPAQKDELYVKINSILLPIESLGTGIHQLIIISAALTIIENSIICIEEPEIHLHPELQRKFYDYIINNTNNQYFISTHSNIGIDYETDKVSVYKCEMIDESTTIEQAIDYNTKIDILRLLGYKASDLMQTNFVVWVEGPSDRIYVKAWLKQINSILKDGYHYSIMYYGGRLLSHITLEQDNLEQYISLLKLNKNTYIIMDSDKTSEESDINDTKKRIINECKKMNIGWWMTRGREIENYIQQDIWENALKNKYDAEKITEYGLFSKITKLANNETIDKIEIANAIVQTVNQENMSHLDLLEKVKQLEKLIINANKGY